MTTAHEPLVDRTSVGHQGQSLAFDRPSTSTGRRHYTDTIQSLKIYTRSLPSPGPPPDFRIEGREFPLSKTEIGHVKTLSPGSNNVPLNSRPLCRPCSRTKGRWRHQSGWADPHAVCGTYPTTGTPTLVLAHTERRTDRDQSELPGINPVGSRRLPRRARRLGDAVRSTVARWRRAWRSRSANPGIAASSG